MTVSVGGDPLDGVVTLKVVGEVDFHNVGGLRDAISQALAGDAGELRLDLSEASFMDSMGVAALVGAYHGGQQTGVPVVITAVHPALHRILWITGILPLLYAEPQPGTAVAAGAFAPLHQPPSSMTIPDGLAGRPAAGPLTSSDHRTTPTGPVGPRSVDTGAG